MTLTTIRSLSPNIIFFESCLPTVSHLFYLLDSSTMELFRIYFVDLKIIIISLLNYYFIGSTISIQMKETLFIMIWFISYDMAQLFDKWRHLSGYKTHCPNKNLEILYSGTWIEFWLCSRRPLTVLILPK